MTVHRPGHDRSHEHQVSATTGDGPPTGAVSPAARRTWFVLGGIITAAVVVCGAVLAAAVLNGVPPPGHSSRFTGTHEGVPGTVLVDGSNAGVELTGAAVTGVTVDVDQSWYYSEPIVDTSRQDSDLFVDLSCSVAGIPVWFAPTCRIDYAARVPASSGAHVELTDGAVTVRGLRGDADLRTTSGNVEMIDMMSDTATAETTAGRISLEFTRVPSRVEAASTAGAIEVRVPRGPAYRVVTESSSGSVDVGVTTDPAAGSIIDLSTTSGGITVTYTD